MDDTALIRQCLEGDRKAFGTLVHKYQGLVYGLACHMIGDFEEAKDIAQAAFIKAYLNLSDLNDPTKFTNWLYKITVNECKMWLRSPLRGQLSLDETIPGDVESGDLPYSPLRLRDAQEQLETEEMHNAALKAVDTLEPKYRLPVASGDLSFQQWRVL